MKVFAINLVEQFEKKEHIINETARVNLDASIVDAINGKNLSEKELETLVYDYANCGLTKSEIGCALSHQYIYKYMIENDIPIALILEDDAVFVVDSEVITSCFNEIVRLDGQQHSPRIYLLSRANSIAKRQKLRGTFLDIYRTYSSYPAHSYVINLAAAKNLHSTLFPIRFEADLWGVFDRLGLVKVYSVIPNLTITNDESWEKSSIQAERSLLTKLDRNKRDIIIKSYKKANIKRFLWRIFIKPFLNIEKKNNR